VSNAGSTTNRLAQAPLQLAKDAESCLFCNSQRVFKLVALLVPGFPSLDAKLYSPGETQRKGISDLMLYRSGDLLSAFAKSLTR
jgi:hypothetical protein